MTEAKELQAVEIPGYRTGTWDIDPDHSEVSFTIRHMLVPVRGSFRRFSGVIATGHAVTESNVSARIEVSSLDTGHPARDNRAITLPDFLDGNTYPEISFVSTGMRLDRRGYLLDGDFTMKNVTKSIVVPLQILGFGYHPTYGTRMGLVADLAINRRDYGVDTWTAPRPGPPGPGNVPLVESIPPLDEGGMLLGDRINIRLVIEAELRGSRPPKAGS